MKQNSWRLFGKLYIALAILFSVIMADVQVYADTFDLSHMGSIAMSLHTADGVAVEGAEFYIYKAGYCIIDGGVLMHDWTADFSSAGIDIGKVNKKETATKAVTYADTAGLSHFTEITDSEGEFKLEDLEVGLYLVTQKNTVSGFTKTSPFFITVGQIDGTDVYYDSDASPKVTIKKKTGAGGNPGGIGGDAPDPTPAPSKSPTPKVTSTVTPEVPGSTNSLAQTGQNRWQIPFMACIGLAFILTGLMLKTGKNED